MKIKNPKLVEVEWVDIFATCGWEKLDEVVPPSFYTYGYMVYKDKYTIKVACTKDENGDGSQHMHFLGDVLKKYAPFRRRILSQPRNKYTIKPQTKT